MRRGHFVLSGLCFASEFALGLSAREGDRDRVDRRLRFKRGPGDTVTQRLPPRQPSHNTR
jgi:hypothetical protein